MASNSVLSKLNLRRFCLVVLVVQAALYVTSGAQSTQPMLMERQKEVELALSACPKLVASTAGVYVLEKPGYVKVRDSQNGFTAIVDHQLPTTQEPQCMDAEGARTILPRILKIAELRAEGKTTEEIERFVADAFAKGTFQPPARPGVDYMLSTQNGAVDEKGFVAKPFPPHVMFYAPYIKNAEIGSDGKPGGTAFIVGKGKPHAFIIVPVASHAGDHKPIDKPGAGSQ